MPNLYHPLKTAALEINSLQERLENVLTQNRELHAQSEEFRVKIPPLLPQNMRSARERRRVRRTIDSESHSHRSASPR